MDKISSSFFIPRNEQGYESIYKRIRLMPLYSFSYYKELKPHLKNPVPKVFLHMDFNAFLHKEKNKTTKLLILR